MAGMFGSWLIMESAVLETGKQKFKLWDSQLLAV